MQASTMKATPNPSLRRLRLRFGLRLELGLGHHVSVGIGRMLKPKRYLGLGLEPRNRAEVGVVCWACG